MAQWAHVSTAGGLSSTPGQGIKIPHAMSQTSLVAQLVRNALAMQDTPVQFLGQEDPLQKGLATHSTREEGVEWNRNSAILSLLGRWMRPEEPRKGEKETGCVC